MEKVYLSSVLRAVVSIHRSSQETSGPDNQGGKEMKETETKEERRNQRQRDRKEGRERKKMKISNCPFVCLFVCFL